MLYYCLLSLTTDLCVLRNTDASLSMLSLSSRPLSSLVTAISVNIISFTVIYRTDSISRLGVY